MDLRVHLKICEACGCLWYRAQVETRVYCSTCLERLKQFPALQGRKRRGRPKKTVLPTVFAVQASTIFHDFHEQHARPSNMPAAGPESLYQPGAAIPTVAAVALSRAVLKGGTLNGGAQ
jgi:hypothetical protein